MALERLFWNAACMMYLWTGTGYPYTWQLRKDYDDEVDERLDMAMVTSSWLDLFQNVNLKNIFASVSDHNPILLQVDEEQLVPSNRKFKFENNWLLEPDLKSIVEESWVGSGSLDIFGRIDRCVEDLSTWGFKLSKRFRKVVSECKRKLVTLYEVDSADAAAQIKEVKDLMLKLLAQGDTFWKQ